MSQDKANLLAMEKAPGLNVFEQRVKTIGRNKQTAEALNEVRPEEQAAPFMPPPVPETKADAKDDLDELVENQFVPPASGNARESQAELMVYLAKGFSSFFHTPDGDAFASITVDNHTENVRVRSQDFKQWLGRLHYKQSRKPPGAQAIKDAMEILEAEGRYDGPSQTMNMRYAEHDGAIYIDLCNSNWNQIRIGKGEWQVIGSKESPVKFHRCQGMAELPVPSQDGTIEQLRRFLNIENDGDWVLIISWLIGAMRPTGPYPVLVLQGEQGTAKSTTARLLRDLIDPSTVPSQSLAKSERDLVIAASKSWVLNFDNLSYLSPAMSDAFCRLSTGGGFRTRALYTDDNERLFHSKRPLIMNGISDFAHRHDLADRSLIIQLPVIPKQNRIPEKELMHRWHQERTGLLGALCNALSVALARVEEVRIATLPRMADFALWATAAEPAFGWPEGSFMREYENNIKRLVDIALEADPVAIAVIRLMTVGEAREWNGTASDLLTFLTHANQDLSAMRSWPRQPNVFSGQLRRAATSLRERGIEIEWVKSGNRLIHISKAPAENEASSAEMMPMPRTDPIEESIPPLPEADSYLDQPLT